MKKSILIAKLLTLLYLTGLTVVYVQSVFGMGFIFAAIMGVAAGFPDTFLHHHFPDFYPIAIFFLFSCFAITVPISLFFGWRTYFRNPMERIYYKIFHSTLPVIINLVVFIIFLKI